MRAAVLLCGLAAAAPAGAAQDQAWRVPLAPGPGYPEQLLAEAGAGAAAVESDHFAVVGTAPGEAARELLQRLESVYQAHGQFITDFRVPVRAPRHKLEVLFFASHNEFRDCLAAAGAESPETLGFYEPCSRRTVFFDLNTYPPLAAIRDSLAQAAPEQREKLRKRFDHRRELLIQSIIGHEAAHQIQHACGLVPAADQVPTWLTEGLAMLFEASARLAAGAASTLPGVGAPPAINNYRLFEYRKLYGDARPTVSQVRQLLIDDAWCGGPCYPLAWAVLRYMRNERPAEFARLLARIAAAELPRGPTEYGVLVDERFGPVDEQWVDRFHTATMRLPLDPAGLGE
jgi:hypothetical protein